MEQGNVEESTSTENAKISDSGYSCNTCSNSQSHTSEGDSLSRNSNRSASSGYHGGNQSTLGSCTETIPKPISNKKEKSHKKKKTKNIITTTALIESTQAPSGCNHAKPEPVTNAQITQQVFEPVKPIVEKKTEEQAIVELVDATDPGVHNDSNSLLPTTATDVAGLAAKINPIDESSSQFTEEYYAVISLRDGLVLQATSSLHGTLGYPKESWTGKFFTDFLDPRDKQIFTETVASEIALWKDYTSSDKTGKKLRIFCRLRQFDAFQSTSKCDESYYVPFRMNLIVQNFQGTDKDSLPSQQPRMLLIASFQPLRSAYKEPEETIIPTIFSTRHNASCHYTFVDQDVVQYMGYLPQDMINRSLFCYYHPEDLPLIKDIYETIINQEESSSFRSKPYRFIVHNGGCIVIDTEWSCFVNPWTKKLEFVVGSHRVLKGPVDPNVFGPFNRKNNALANISEEVLKEARVIRREIEDMLVQGVQMRLRPPNNDALLSKTNDFTTFVENVLQELRSPVPLKDHMAVDDRSFSEHDSIMLGEISPHHEYLDSNSSTETPPSYNQLNYNDTIERFFNSNVVVQGAKGPFASDSEEIAQSSANSSEELGKNNNKASRPDGRRNKDLKCAASSTNGSGNSGSNEMLSSESNNQQSFSGGTNSNATTSQTTTNNSSSNNNNNNNNNNNKNNNKNKGFKPPLLTESILHKHNAEMETLMVQKHRELKKGDKIRNKSNDQKAKAAAAAAAAAQSGQAPNNAANNKSSNRLKRSASQTRDPEGNFKMSKYDETLKSSQQQQQQNNLGQAIPTTNNAFANKANNRAGNLLSQPMPASLAAPAPTPTASGPVNNQCFANANICPQATTRYPPGFFQMLPVYYMPVPAAAPIPRENPAALGTAAAPQDQQQQQHHHHMGFPSTMNPGAAPYCYVPMPCMPAPMSGLMYPPTAFGSQHHLAHPITAAAAGMYNRSQAMMMPEAVATSTGNLNNMNASLAAPQAQTQLNPAQFLQAGQQLQQAQVQQMQTPVPTMSPFDDDSNNKKRPASRATSVKAEPGSSMAMSESSKKIFSPAGIVSSCLTDDGGGYVPTSSSRINRDCQSNSSASQQLTNSSSFGLYQTTKSRESWTDNGTSNKSFGVTRKEPPWIEEVNLTTELIYQFQLGSRSLGSVLQRDLEFLKSTKQPSLVNDQLGQLFLDLDLEGFGSKPILEEIGSNNTPDTGSDLSQSPSQMGAW